MGSLGRKIKRLAPVKKMECYTPTIGKIIMDTGKIIASLIRKKGCEFQLGEGGKNPGRGKRCQKGDLHGGIGPRNDEKLKATIVEVVKGKNRIGKGGEVESTNRDIRDLSNRYTTSVAKKKGRTWWASDPKGIDPKKAE